MTLGDSARTTEVCVRRKRDPSVSVIIATYNQEHLVGEVLAGLEGQTWRGPLEILVADNGSVDNTANVARLFCSRLPGLKVISVTRAQGQCVARNDAVAIATGDLLLFTDGDDIPASEWVERMVRAALHTDLVGGRLDPFEINSRSAVARWPGLAGNCLTGFDFIDMPYATGTNLGVWRDVFDAVGPWDESYIGGGEDAAFCWRAQIEGFRLDAAPDAVVHYRLRTTLRAQIKQSFGYGRAVGRLRRDFAQHVRRPAFRLGFAGKKKRIAPILARLVGSTDERARIVIGLAYRAGKFYARLAGRLNPKAAT